MNQGGKNSAEVVEFMTSFAKLKDWCDDAPKELTGFAMTDSSLCDLCVQVWSATRVLKMGL